MVSGEKIRGGEVGGKWREDGGGRGEGGEHERGESGGGGGRGEGEDHFGGVPELFQASKYLYVK